MDQLISDESTDGCMAGLERIIVRYLGARRPEFGASTEELGYIEMPNPLRRVFQFAVPSLLSSFPLTPQPSRTRDIPAVPVRPGLIFCALARGGGRETGLLVTGEGNVTYVTTGGDAVSLTGCTVGQVLGVHLIAFVKATGTTATLVGVSD